MPSIFTFPFFLLRLVVVIAPDLARAVFIQLPLLGLISMALGVLLMQVGFAGMLPLAEFTPVSPTPPQIRSFNTTSIEPSAFDTQVNYWHELEVLQPTHRDVLINNALLARYTNNPETAQKYWRAAWVVDPNHPLFTVETCRELEINCDN